LNLDSEAPRTKVYVSSSGDTSYAGREGDWAKWIEDVPIITRIEGGEIVVEGDRRVTGVDVVIFATGYWYALPFCQAADAPWRDIPVLSDTDDNGSLKGFHMDELDASQLFLKADRSIAFPTLRESCVGMCSIFLNTCTA